VQYLPKLANDLRQRLEALRRLDWVMEECQRLEQVRQSPPNPPEVQMLRIKGSSRLAPRSLAVLKELFLFREEEARRMDCPPFRVLSNEAMITLANSPDLDLHKVRGLPGGIARRAGNLIREALQRGKDGPEVYRPSLPNHNPWDAESHAKLRSLKEWRTRQGASLELDPALIWPAASLERLALGWNGAADEPPDDGAQEVRDWQRREFSEDLLEALAEASAVGD
jgi:ribonuclease D